MLGALFWIPVFVVPAEAVRPFSACIAFDDFQVEGDGYEYEFPLIAEGRTQAVAVHGSLPALDWNY
jgi:hypothetical protein